MSDKARAHLLISGRVQGVFYRAHTRDEARRRGLTGWVRNLPDGRVAVVVEGDRRQIDSLIAWCRQGPPYAYVEEVQVDWHPYQGEFDDFRIAY